MIFTSTKFPLGGFQSDFENAESVVFGSPLDQSGTYRKGYRAAPNAIRKLAMHLETVDPYSGKDLAQVQIHDMGDINCRPQELLRETKTIIDSIVKKNIKPLMLGGEHTVTYATRDAFTDHLFIIFDAHLDLREEYDGNKFSHACVTRRLLDHILPEQLIFIGTRAVSLEERNFLEAQPKISCFWGHNWNKSKEEEAIETIKNIAESWSGIYLSIDMDGFDPSFVPGVGNPEPLGLSPKEFFSFLNRLPTLNGFDITELNPNFDDNEVSAAVAARLAFSLLTNH